MNKALFILNESDFSVKLNEKLNQFFPNIALCGCCEKPEEVVPRIHCSQPNLVFVDIDSEILKLDKLFQIAFDRSIAVILISNFVEYAVKAINYQVSGYLLKPLQDQQFITAVQNANSRLQINEEENRGQDLMLRSFKLLPPNDIIGIPTLEGLEFLSVSDIIRCQGLQKCTRVIIRDRKDLVSSYNIGAFCKMLGIFGFFSTHKSHLVNLRHIKRYLKEGTVIMIDNSIAPVSKRRKREFLDLLIHL